MWRELALGLSGPLSPMRQAQPVGFRAGQALMPPEWRAEVAGWAAHFSAQPGAAVALYFEDSLHAAAALFGAWHAGKTVWWPGDALPATAERLARDGTHCAGDWPAADCVRVAPQAEPAWQPLDAQAPALVVFTSGSTGEPVAIPKRLHQLFDEVRALEACFGSRLEGARVVGTVSHQHIYGLLFRLLWPLAAGRPIVAERQAYLEDLARMEGLLALVASPAHLKRLALPDLAGLPARLAVVFSSGGPLPDEALAPCAVALGQTPIEVYGSSETGGVAWRQRAAGDDAQHPWRALPGVDWRIEDEQLELRSPQLGTEAWYRAADRVRAEGPGFVLLGRADRIVKIEEKRVSLAAIEQALLALGGLQELRLPLLPGRRQELGVVLVPTAEAWAAIEAEGRTAWLRPRKRALEPLLEATVRPRRWRLVSELPVNAQGKTTQVALAALFDPMRPSARLLVREPQRACWAIDVEDRHPGFDGHFPGHPVLPGVVQLDWAERFGREAFVHLLPAFAGLDQLKFQQVIPPGARVELELQCDEAGRELRFALRSASGAHASGRLRFGPAGEGA